jgi:ethanolamine permease
VGSSIGGNFVGWNSGLQAGLGGALVGLAISTILYGTLSLSIAEMGAHSARLGGSHTFVGESPMGRLGAYMTGIAELLKIVPTGAAFALGIQGYLTYGMELGQPAQGMAEVGVWVALYAVFTALNMRGLEISVNAQLAVTFTSLGVLLAFYVLALPSTDFHRYALSSRGGDGWFMGPMATMSSLSYSADFYLGLESVPLLAGSVRNPAIVVPRAIVYSMATLGAAGILTLVLNSSVAPGVEVLQHSSAPLLDGFRALTQNPWLLSAASAFINSGLVVGFHVFVLFAGETVAILAKDGIVPACLGAVHPKLGTPHVALLGSSALGLALLGVTAHALPPSKCMSVLINMAVSGALVAYMLQFLAYLSRPWAGTTTTTTTTKATVGGFRSPLGKPGACAGFAMACLLLVSQLIHATQDTAEAVGLLVSGIVFAAALALYRWGPFVFKPSRAAKAARAARTHADSLAEGELGGAVATGMDVEDGEGRPMLDHHHWPVVAGGAATPQRRKLAGAGLGLWERGPGPTTPTAAGGGPPNVWKTEV